MTSLIRPGSVCVPGGSGSSPATRVIFSGRTVIVWPSRSIRLETPMNPATNGVRGRSDTPAHPQPVLDVLRHAHVREQGVVLEHGVDVPGVRRHPGDVAAAELDPPGVRPLEPGDQPEQGGLARTGRPEQGEELAGPDLQVDIGERGHAAVPLPQAGDVDRRCRGSRITCRGGLGGARNRDHPARCTTVQPGPATRLPARSNLDFMEWTGQVYADAPVVAVQIRVDAPPERVWELVSDIIRMPELGTGLQEGAGRDGDP